MLRAFTKDHPIRLDDLKHGGLILIDKPLHWTSFDVVNKLRYAIRRVLGQKKYKIGHTGTLDPLASGLLIVCFGSYTKKIEQLSSDDKSYEGTIVLGRETPSYDAETQPNCYYPKRAFTPQEIDRTRTSFEGDILQIPPMYSAVKSKGVALYKLARKGKVVERPPRPVTIHRFLLTLDRPNILSFDISCSKGTYIRTIAHDFGKKLSYGSYLGSLRRTSVGEYSVEDAWTLDLLVDQINQLEVCEKSNMN